jgi:hypothetical protein
MTHPDQPPTIAAADLVVVTGGATAASSSTSNNQQTLALMQSLQSSIQSLASQKNGSNNGIAQLLPLLALRGGGGACPCGCGMANCIRR